MRPVLLNSACTCSIPKIGVLTGYVYASHYADGSVIPDEALEGRVQWPCACAETENKANRPALYRKWANLPDVMGTFSGYHASTEAQRMALAAVRAWARGEGSPILFLGGTTGTGKTHLATAAVSALVGEGIYARYEFYPDLVDFLRANQLEYAYTERHTQLQSVEALVLDELGATSSTMTDFGLGEAYKIIDYRYRHDKPLLVATNIPPKVWQTADARIYSRLMDHHRAVQVQMAWDDERLNDGATA